MTRFFRQPNLATDRVYPIEEPWNFKVPENIRNLDKEQYKAFYKNPETDHCLLYMAEAANPDYVVSAGNQAAVLYGFMADYDGILTDDLIEVISKKGMSKYKPAYWCRSQSGKLHLFWFFERGIAVTGNAHANALLQIVSRKVKAGLWAVGFDPNSTNVTQCMDIGYDWRVFCADAKIPAEELILWDYALFESRSREMSKDVVSIPFEVVAEEVKKRQWPNPPPLNFCPGTRCVRFWDPSADNSSGAQITKDGIRVYTPHDNGFKSWRSLLGAEFCEQYIAKSTAPFIEDTYYCHKKDEYYRYFRVTDRNRIPHYEDRTEKVLRRELVLEAKLSDKVAKGEELSEVAKMLDTIIKRNSVCGAAPIIYRPSGRLLMPEFNDFILNTSLVTVRGAADRLVSVDATDLDKYEGCPRKYREDPLIPAWDNPFVVSGFPNIHRWLTSVFLPNRALFTKWKQNNFRLHDSQGRPFCGLADNQLIHLLSWMHHFYRHAARMSAHPPRGQVLIIAGPPGVGKSFFAKHLLGLLMGNAVEADKLYLDGSRFTSSYISSPVHLIDDKLGSRTQRERLKFTELLKVAAASGSIRYEAKFGSALESIPWAGRIVITANDDIQSLSVMPDLDMSTRDKFMMLKFGPAKYFPDGQTFAETYRWLDEELPYFARFLLEWRIPTDIADSRFGVQAIQHPDMARASAENGNTQTVIDVLESCIELTTGTQDPKDRMDAKGWAVEGPAVKILKWIRSVDETLAREVIDSRTLNQSLQILYRNGGYNIVRDGNRWYIPYVLRKESEETRS